MSTNTPTIASVAFSQGVAARPRRRSYRHVWGIGLFGVGLGLAGLGYWLGIPGMARGDDDRDAGFYIVAPATLNVTLKEDGEIKPVNSVDIKCEVQAQGGLTIEWIVPESTRVKQGDKLVRFAADDFEQRVTMEELEVTKLATSLEEARESLLITESDNKSRIAQAEVNLKVAELELLRYIHGDYPTAKNDIEINIAKTKMNLAQKEDEHRKNVRLFDKNFVTQAKLDELDLSIQQLKLTLNKHELELASLENYELPKNKMQKESAVVQARDELDREIKQASSRMRQEEARVADRESSLQKRMENLARLQSQLEKCEIFSPVDGVVQYGGTEGRRWGGNLIAPGETVRPGQTLITIPDTTQLMVSTRIHEADRHLIGEGLPCIVRVPAVPGRVFTGRLSKVAQFADSGSSWLNPDLKEHQAEIVLDETDADISPGDTAQVEILIKELPDVLAVPVQTVYSRGSRHFIFVKHAGAVEPVEVKLGHSSTAMIEVLDGVQPDTKVLMNVDDGLLAKLPAPGSLTAPAFAREPDAQSPDGERRGRDQSTPRAAERSSENKPADQAADTTAPTADAAAAPSGTPRGDG